VLSALIATAAFLAPTKISQFELEREALIAATRFKAQMLKEPDALFYALTSPSQTPQFADILNKSGYGPRVLRHELYDQAGVLTFTSGLAGMTLDNQLAVLLASPADEAPKVVLYQSSDKTAPSNFAALTLPLAVAEDTGLIVPLGEWVLRRACSDAVKWPEPLFVSVNLSPAQFRDGDVAETVAQVLKETGLAPERLELEITENLLINDTEEVLSKLNRLRQLGVSIAMDDFGTGFSSLSYLARFPFSKIKIDRQFIRNMTRDPAMRAIVKTIIALGKSLDVTITAEGVETEEQAAMLREFGCPQVQGFLYGYPSAPDSDTKPAEGKVTPISSARSSAA
jgi:EAL domain-containing protein (putative c-di-GMP-specific phosphodiesterase class I)